MSLSTTICHGLSPALLYESAPQSADVPTVFTAVLRSGFLVSGTVADFRRGSRLGPFARLIVRRRALFFGRAAVRSLLAGKNTAGEILKNRASPSMCLRDSSRRPAMTSEATDSVAKTPTRSFWRKPRSSSKARSSSTPAMSGNLDRGVLPVSEQIAEEVDVRLLGFGQLRLRQQLR